MVNPFLACEFNVSRDTIRKGTYELESGFNIVDAHNAKGRKKADEKLPNLIDDIKEVRKNYGGKENTVILAYYPPYHSKYNPIERVCGALEKHWNGSILDSLDVVYKFTQNMTWKGNQPSVSITENSYETGIQLKKI